MTFSTPGSFPSPAKHPCPPSRTAVAADRIYFCTAHRHSTNNVYGYDSLHTRGLRKGFACHHRYWYANLLAAKRKNVVCMYPLVYSIMHMYVPDLSNPQAHRENTKKRCSVGGSPCCLVFVTTKLQRLKGLDSVDDLHL